MDPYLGEIRMFAGNFAPEDWHLCDGSMLSVSTYSTLFSLLGTTFGGDGRSTFGVPDLRGRIPIGQGTGTGLSPRVLGQTGGTETVTLTTAQLPAHGHTLNATTSDATASVPGPAAGLAKATNPSSTHTPLRYVPYAAAEKQLTLAALTIANAGGNTSGGTDPHANVMPSTVLSYIISLSGLYPQRA
jgi:microcystin-dependent protein